MLRLKYARYSNLLCKFVKVQFRQHFTNPITRNKTTTSNPKYGKSADETVKPGYFLRAACVFFPSFPFSIWPSDNNTPSSPYHIVRAHSERVRGEGGGGCFVDKFHCSRYKSSLKKCCILLCSCFDSRIHSRFEAFNPRSLNVLCFFNAQPINNHSVSGQWNVYAHHL